MPSSHVRGTPWGLRAASCCLGLLCLFLTASPGHAVDLTPWTFFAGDTPLGAAGGDQIAPSIAAGNGQYLVAWTDKRGMLSTIGGEADIWAARLDGAGTVIDSIPIPVTLDHNAQSVPQVVWNGANWLVVWTSLDPTPFYYASAIHAARVSPAGVVLDQPSLTLRTFANSSTAYTVSSSDGVNWIVLWEGTAVNEAAIEGVRISPSGVVLDATPKVVVPETYFIRFNLDFAFSGSTGMVVWSESGPSFSDDVVGVRMDAALTPLDVTPLKIAQSVNPENYPRIAGSGSDFLVVWQGSRITTTAPRAARVTQAGVVRDPTGIALTNTVGTTNGFPQVGWDGTNWRVVWQGAPMAMARVTTAGAVLDLNGVTLPGTGLGAFAVSPGGAALLAWADTRAGGSYPSDIYSASVSSTLVTAPAAPACYGAPAQLLPRTAAGTHTAMTVFQRRTSAGSSLCAQAIDAQGQSVMSEPRVLTANSTASGVSVAFNGMLYLAVWADNNMLYGLRLAEDGSALDGTPFAIAAGDEPDVAALGDTFLVVATQTQGYPELRAPFAVRVRGADAQVLDGSGFWIGSTYSYRPRVARVGDRWLATWEVHPTHDDPHSNVAAAFVTRAGAAVPEFSLTQYFNFYANRPCIASSGDTAVIAWEDPRVSSAYDWNIYARRVLASGAVLDPSSIALTTAANFQTAASLAWDGTQFVAVWEDRRSEASLWDYRADLYGTRLTTQGQVLDPAGFVVATDAVHECEPSLAARGGTTWIVASVLRPAAPYAAYRLGARVLGAPVAIGDPRAESARRAAIGPNPFAVALDLRWPMAQRGSVRILTVDGRLVRRLHVAADGRGGVASRWLGDDDQGARVAAGVYLVSGRIDGVPVGYRVVKR